MPEFKVGDVVRFKAQPEYRFAVGELHAGRAKCFRLYKLPTGTLGIDETEFSPCDIEHVPPPFVGECCDDLPMCCPDSCSIEQSVEKATVEDLLQEAADLLESEGFDRLAGQVDGVLCAYEWADKKVKE